MLEYHSRLERHTSMQRILLTSCQRRSNICSALRKNFIFFQKPAWQIAKWVYIKTVITDKVMIPKWRGSSVGRAEDWKSSCHQFDPGPCHHFFVYTPDGDTPFGFFLALFWGWFARNYDFFCKTENLKSPHSGGLKSAKIPQILRLAIFGDTGIFQVVTACYAKKILQNCHCFSFFSSKCNGEFLYTNRSPLGIIFTNQRVTTKTEIFVLLTNAHQKTDVAVSPFAILYFHWNVEQLSSQHFSQCGLTN